MIPEIKRSRGRPTDRPDEDRDRLATMWMAGAPVAAICAALGRSDHAVRHARRRFSLPARAQGAQSLRSAAEFGIDPDLAQGAIAEFRPALTPETGGQALMWGRAMTDIRFDDDPRARRPEAALRGLPADQRSATGCAAAMVVAAA